MSRIEKLREREHTRKHKLSELPVIVRKRVLAHLANMVERWEREHGRHCRQPMRAILESTAMRVESDPSLARRQAGRKSWRVRIERDEAEARQHMKNISRIGVNARRFQRETGRRYKEGWKTLERSPAPPALVAAPRNPEWLQQDRPERAGEGGGVGLSWSQASALGQTAEEFMYGIKPNTRKGWTW